MKKIFALIILLCILFSGCDLLYESAESYLSEEKNTAAEEETATPNPDDDGIYNQYNTYELEAYPPELYDLDYSEMDFFTDGYEVVELVRITDGDTAVFLMDGEQVKCRFVGINTPELNHDGGADDPYAQEATDYTEAMLKAAETIILDADYNAGEYDDYGRLLAHVWADGKLVGWYLAYEGLADLRYYHDDYEYYDSVEEARFVAEEYGLGIWGE